MCWSSGTSIQLLSTYLPHRISMTAHLSSYYWHDSALALLLLLLLFVYRHRYNWNSIRRGGGKRCNQNTANLQLQGLWRNSLQRSFGDVFYRQQNAWFCEYILSRFCGRKKEPWKGSWKTDPLLARHLPTQILLPKTTFLPVFPTLSWKSVFFQVGQVQVRVIFIFFSLSFYGPLDSEEYWRVPSWLVWTANCHGKMVLWFKWPTKVHCSLLVLGCND